MILGSKILIKVFFLYVLILPIVDKVFSKDQLADVFRVPFTSQSLAHRGPLRAMIGSIWLQTRVSSANHDCWTGLRHPLGFDLVSVKIFLVPTYVKHEVGLLCIVLLTRIATRNQKSESNQDVSNFPLICFLPSPMVPRGTKLIRIKTSLF